MVKKSSPGVQHVPESRILAVSGHDADTASEKPNMYYLPGVYSQDADSAQSNAAGIEKCAKIGRFY